MASRTQRQPVQQPLTFFMPIRRDAIASMRTTLDELWTEVGRSSFDDAFDAMATVHSARFAVLEDPVASTPWATLVFVATYDGGRRQFVEACATALEDEWRALLASTDDFPASRDPGWAGAFASYVDAHELSVHREHGRLRTDEIYSAYPDLTVSDLRAALERRTGAPAPPGGRPPHELIQDTLTLVMPTDAAMLPALKQSLAALRPPDERSTFDVALDKIGTVHASRFLALQDTRGGNEPRWARLAVAATYDGDFDDYIRAFAAELNHEFNLLFRFVDDRPNTPVKDNVDEFVDYVQRHAAGPTRTYSAYPQATALDLWAAARPERDARPRLQPAQTALPQSLLPIAEDEPAGLQLDDIQGLILRGYPRMRTACHLVLRIDDPAPVRQVLAGLTDETADTGPYITVASDWIDKPPKGEPPTHCVNIGLTFDGLRALELPCWSLASFPAEFREGAAARAERIGDPPETTWIDELRADVHAVLSVHAQDADHLDEVTADLRRQLDGGATVLRAFHAAWFGDGTRVHFGYTDGLSQPTIEGAPMAGIRDPFPPVAAGEFVLGQESGRGGPSGNPVPAPAWLGRNGSFAAFRVMRQDVGAFERYLEDESARTGLDVELLAAKLCGRWRSGEALVMRPTAPGERRAAREDLNDFDYEPAEREAAGGDPQGIRCPYGAHIRRAFPRGQRVVDDYDGLRRRLVRRAMPYGPAYEGPEDEQADRGLVGMFICASLAGQFEYVLKHWINGGLFTGGGLHHSRDPFADGSGGDATGFRIPGKTPVDLHPMPRVVRTLGSAYLFLPSMTALRGLARRD